MSILNLLISCITAAIGGLCWYVSRKRKLHFMWWVLRVAPLYLAVVTPIPFMGFVPTFLLGFVVVLAVALMCGWRPRMVENKVVNVALSVVLLPMVYLVVFIALAGVCMVSETALWCALPASWCKSWHWDSVGMTDQMPFALEYRAAHPFLAEYERRLVFASGRKVELEMDTGGGGCFAVYALGGGKYCLVDGLRVGTNNSRYMYVVDVGRQLLRSIGRMPQRNERRFIGFACPNGRFVAGNDDPIDANGVCTRSLPR